MNAQTSDIKEKIKSKWNEEASGFDHKPGYAAHSKEKKETKEKSAWKSIFISFLGEQPLTILDVGTGTGFIALMLAELGHRVTGVDIADSMLRQAIQKAERHSLDVKFMISDADRLPFDNETFDIVINRHVFWALPQPETAAAEWLRVLKPGGAAIVIDGDWFTNSLWKTLWKSAASVAVWLSGGENNHKKGKRMTDFEKNLPLSSTKRPEEDLKIWKNLGAIATAKPFKDPRAYGFLNNIKHGYNRRFIVTALKK